MDSSSEDTAVHDDQALHRFNAFSPLLPLILIVDGERARFESAAQSLEKQGFRVMGAEDGQEAQHRADLMRPDLILLDIMPPGMDGVELCRQLKAQNATSDIPVVFMIAADEAEWLPAGFEAGGVDYVFKPLGIEEVAVRINLRLKLNGMQKQAEAQNAVALKYRQTPAGRMEACNLELCDEVTGRKRAEADLRKRELYYQEIFHHIADSIYLLEVTEDGRFRYLETNRAFEALMQVPADGLRGQYAGELTRSRGAVKSADAILAKLLRCLEAGSVIDEEIELHLPVGRRILHSTLIPLFDDAGHINRILGISRDMTERKQNQYRLEIINFALDHVREAAFLFDEQGRIVHVNAEACRSLGYSAEELLAKMPFDINPLLTMDSIGRIDKQLAEHGHLMRESQHKSKDGLIFPVEIAIAEFAFNGKRMALALCRDITERKRVEAEKQRLLDILEESADFIGSADLQGNLLYHNRAARRMVGLPEDADLTGMHISDIHPASAMTVLRETAIPILREKGVWRGDSTLLHCNGREIPVSLLKVLHRDADGNPEFTSAIMQDITERKRVEDALKFIAQRGWTEGGESFLTALAGYLGRTLAVDYVIIDKLGAEPAYAETVAIHAGGRMLPNIQYNLKGTPCENIMEGKLCCYPENVQQQFPADTLLADMQVESYAGLPLWDSGGKTIGLIAVMDGKPMHDAAAVTSLLQLVAASAAAELARQQSEKALAESWRFLNRVIDTIADPVFVKDRRHRWILLNQAFCEFIGHPLEALLGKSDAEFFPANEVEAFRTNDDLVFNSGAEVVNEEAFTGRDGVTHTIVTKKTSYTDESGQLMLVGVIRDITERKRLEAQLAKQAQELRTLVEHAPDNIIRYDSDTRATYVNPQLLKTLNRTPEDVLGKRANERLDEQHPAMRGYVAALQHVIETGQPEEYLLEVEEGYFGRAVYDNIHFAPEFSADGKVAGVIAIGRNYTRQRQLELELARREREFRTLAENSPDMIVRYDRDCRRVYANRAYMVSLAATAADALGKTPLEFWRLAAPCAEKFTCLLMRVMVTGSMEGIQVERLDDKGRLVYFAMHLVPEFNHNGEISSVLSISRDITGLKATEQRLEESRAQLRALTAQREETREDERKRIARELHDELGQRLTALRMDISRLRLRFGQDNPALLEQVREMVAAVDTTIQVVRDVAAALRPAVLDMGIVSALEWLVDDFGKRAGIQCGLLIPRRDIALDDSQSTAIFRIVQESLTNAARHAEANKVRVVLARDDDGYLLEIRDDGKGFDLEARKKNGSFGLIGIEERVLMLGGELTVDTEPGRGVKLSVRLSARLSAPNVTR